MTDRGTPQKDDQGGYVEDWTREGFAGDKALVRRPHYPPDFINAVGPHAPRRLNINDVRTANAAPFDAPVAVATARTGLRLSIARRLESMPYVMRNVECDEVHFIQQGDLRVRTGAGTIDARAGDFVCIPRSVAYQIVLLGSSALTVVIECPSALQFRKQEGPTAIDHLSGVSYAELERPGQTRGETRLILKSVDDFTEFLLPEDPLTAIDRVGGVNPVWKLSLADIPPNCEGSPVPFLGTSGNDLLLFTLSASRRLRRPKIHVNADYDEVVYYFAGPGAWGEVDEPGTLAWVPKGVTHHGPSENVPDGYFAWLLESRATLRFTPAALAIAELMETGLYGKHKRYVTAGSF